MKIVILEQQRGLVFQNGKLEKVLETGKHNIINTQKKVEILDMEKPLCSEYCTLETLLQQPQIAKQTVMVEVKDQEVALHYVDGHFYGLLKTGKYVFWNVWKKHTFEIIDIKEATPCDDMPKYIFDKMPSTMKIVILEQQKGLVFQNGKLTKILETGKYMIYDNQKEVEILDMEQPLYSEYCTVETLLQQPQIAEQTVMVEVKDQEVALHYVDDNFHELLKTGKYVFWNVWKKHTFQMVDITEPAVSDDIPKYIFDKIPSTHYIRVEVAAYEKARLYYDKTLVRLLDTGIYYFWKTSTKVQAGIVDMRLLQMEVNGQEVLTQDKVTIRVNFVCHYKITDYVKVLTEIDDYKEQMHVAIQLALREYVAKYRMDELLENKQEVSDFVFQKLKEKEEMFYVDILDAGIKDLILPGDVRDIMNTVLLAEKRAQANVITRREEVASTRSLLNTAKLMEENKILYQLKKLEYLERICENVGNIQVNGGQDLLTQLTTALQGNG